MFGYVDAWMDNPLEMLLFLAMALPGRLIAISAHELAHGWVAYRCGDPTAKYMGRLSMNPLRHIDPIGLAMMLLLGFGWAKPVPVNPNYYKHPRRDDFLVSIAGVTVNFLLFVLGCAGMYAWLSALLHALPEVSYMRLREGVSALTVFDGKKALFDGQYLYSLKDIVFNAPFLSEELIGTLSGKFAGILYRMLGYFVQTNIALAVFNLIPLPPLDGYHVLNDLLLRRENFFANPKVMRACTGIMMILMVTGVLSTGMGAVLDWIFAGAGKIASALMGMG